LQRVSWNADQSNGTKAALFRRCQALQTAVCIRNLRLLLDSLTSMLLYFLFV
jgi:hypothetical protein